MPPGGGVKRFARAVQRRLPPAAQQRAEELLQRARSHEPEPRPTALLSVVMAVYNVERYLAEAVESILQQSYRDLELILVDDCSPDRSGAMCDEFARRDPRVRVLHKPVNGGLGAARNSGLELVRGDYLAFADSDDTVAPGAYQAMISSLERTGSDVVTGNVHRKRGDHEYQAWNQSHTHGEARNRVRLGDFPELLFDTVVWNKVYRTRFWREHVPGFPERKLYEDILPIFAALSHARAIDVLPETVYVWHVRGGSITQQLRDPRNVGDRFEMLDQVDDALATDPAGPALVEALIRKILEGDLWMYVPELGPEAPAEMVARVEAAAGRYWPRASATNRALIPVPRRVAYALLADGRVADVPAFLDWYEDVRRALPIRRDGERLYLEVAGSPVDLAGINDDLVDVTSVAEGVAAVTSVRWTGPTTLTVDGWAYTRFVSAGTQDITLVATHAASGATLTLPVERTASVEAALKANDVASAHDRDGFSATFDVTVLAAVAARGEWVLSAHIVDGAVDRTVELAKITRTGSAAVVGTAALPDGALAQVDATDAPALTVRLDRPGVVAGSCTIDGDLVTIALADPDEMPSELWLASPDAKVAAAPAGASTFSARLPMPAPGTAVTWRVLTRVGGRQRPVVGPASLATRPDPNALGLRPAVTRAGRLLVEAQAGLAIVDEIDVTDAGAIVLGGPLFGLDEPQIGIGPGDGPPSAWHEATVADGRFRAVVPTGTGSRPLRTGGYRLHARDAELIVGPAASSDLPFTHLTDTTKLTFTRRRQARLGVDVAGPVPDELLSRYAQEQLIDQHATTPRELEEAVFFVVDLGANTGDTALALHQELRRRGAPLRLYWGVEDHHIVVPEGGIPVLKFSTEWYARLNTCRYVVNNYGGVWGLRRDAAQRYLQTWHGTPLKFIGVSEHRQANAPPSRLATVARESADWDALVSPSPYFSELARTEFRYEGPLLETGYPRNDRLALATAADVVAVRADLRLPPDAKVLLYAPTYREEQRRGWKAELFDGLDLDRLLELLGPEWHVLLRGHSFAARSDYVDRTQGRVVDVTRHPDINDLYLAADVLVTDYSSVMFDFAVTRKPMAFFVPDLERYAATRGMYFELSDCAPGPLCTEVTDLAAQLRDLAELAERHRDRYDAFRARFAPWDDGKAAARVVDAFFGIV